METKTKAALLVGAVALAGAALSQAPECRHARSFTLPPDAPVKAIIWRDGDTQATVEFMNGSTKTYPFNGCSQAALETLVAVDSKKL